MHLLYIQLVVEFLLLLLRFNIDKDIAFYLNFTFYQPVLGKYSRYFNQGSDNFRAKKLETQFLSLKCNGNFQLKILRISNLCSKMCQSQQHWRIFEVPPIQSAFCQVFFFHHIESIVFVVSFNFSLLPKANSNFRISSL